MGSYNFTIIATDGLGNTVQDEVVVNVVTAGGSAGTNPLLIGGIVAGGVGIAGISFAMIRARKKRFASDLDKEFEDWETSAEKK